MKKFIVILLVFISVCASINGQGKTAPAAAGAQITFIELGSVSCIPCKKMQPVMKSIKKKYGNRVKVVFYDVWKDDQKQYSKMYGVKLIPTQIFLDANGKEFFRHEGFFPEKEIDKLLLSKGLKTK